MHTVDFAYKQKFKLAMVFLALYINQRDTSPAWHSIDVSADEETKEGRNDSLVLESNEFEEVESIVRSFTRQFRDIIEDIIIQMFEYLKGTFHRLRIRLLKRLGQYTLSDVFRATFDGVANFVVDSSSSEDDSMFDTLRSETPATPSYNYDGRDPNPYSRRSSKL